MHQGREYSLFKVGTEVGKLVPSEALPFDLCLCF